MAYTFVKRSLNGTADWHCRFRNPVRVPFLYKAKNVVKQFRRVIGAVFRVEIQTAGKKIVFHDLKIHRFVFGFAQTKTKEAPPVNHMGPLLVSTSTQPLKRSSMRYTGFVNSVLQAPWWL